MTPNKHAVQQAMQRTWQQLAIVKTLRAYVGSKWRHGIALCMCVTVCLPQAFAQAPAPTQAESRLDTVAVQLAFDRVDPSLEAALRVQLNARIRYQAEQLGPWMKEKIEQQAGAALAALGYLNPVIAVEVSSEPAAIKLSIAPGTATRIVAFDVQVNAGSGQADSKAPSTSQLRKDLLDPLVNPSALRAMDVFTAQTWEKFKAEALALVQKRAFLNAEIQHSEAVLDAQTNEARVKLVINTGAPVYLSSIRLHGAKRYPETKIRELLGLSSGELYDAQLFARAQLALLDTRWFHSVTINTATDSQAGNVILDVTVVERPSQLLTLGAGFSTDLGARAKLSFEDNSIGPSAWSVNSSLTITQKKQSAELGLKTAPSGQGIVVGSTLKFDRQDISGETIDATALTIYRSKRGETIETVTSISFQRERQTIGGQVQERMRALVPAWSWNQRVLDDRINPRSGFTVNTQLSGAAKWLGSSTNFTRAYIRGLWLRPLGSERDAPGLSLRGEAGNVNTSAPDLVPSENLFRAGGSQSIRGYAYQSLGRTQVSADGLSSAIVGVEKLFTASAEIKVPLTRFNDGAPPLDLAVFYDTGAVATRFNQMKLVSGYGVGMRWRSIVGPINLDLAYADQLRKMRLHFSVGFTF
jgi:translocation and assembly module TamA